MSARDALIEELERAEADSDRANEAYATAERKMIEAQRASGHAYERRAEAARLVDRLTKALALVEGDTDD